MTAETITIRAIGTTRLELSEQIIERATTYFGGWSFDVVSLSVLEMRTLGGDLVAYEGHAQVEAE